MRISTSLAAVAVLAMASVSQAQDAQCQPIYNDYVPNVSGAYQKCYTDQIYNAALVAQGSNPNFKDLINQVCSKSACSSSTLATATQKYLTACSASIDAEASKGNILQIGKNALYVFFAEPIRNAFCAEDPNAPKLPPPAVNPPAYCLAGEATNPTSVFVKTLAIYLTSGTIRSSQPHFFAQIDPKDTCSTCSQLALTSTIEYLSKNLMPKITPFYTPEFVQYWQKLLESYNGLCKSKLTQTWPEGTLNQTVPDVPTGSPTVIPPVVTSAPVTTTTGNPTSGAGALKPAGAAVAILMAVAAFF